MQLPCKDKASLLVPTYSSTRGAPDSASKVIHHALLPRQCAHCVQIAAAVTTAHAPSFNCSFVFTEEPAAIFTSTSAVVVEYYMQLSDRGQHIHRPEHDVCHVSLRTEWSPRASDLLAYTCVPLDLARYSDFKCNTCACDNFELS